MVSETLGKESSCSILRMISFQLQDHLKPDRQVIIASDIEVSIHFRVLMVPIDPLRGFIKIRSKNSREGRII